MRTEKRSLRMLRHLAECGVVSPAAFVKAQREALVRKIHLGTHLYLEPFHTKGAYCLSLDPFAKRYLLSGGADGSLCVHDLLTDIGLPKRTCKATGKVHRTEAHGLSVSSVNWFPWDAGRFASSSTDGTVATWDGGRMVQINTQNVGEAIYSHHVEELNPNILAVGTERRRVAIVDSRWLQLSHKMRGHDSSVYAVRWSPRQPNLLASGSADGTVRLWDARAPGESMATIPAHRGGVTALTFLPDGTQFMSTGNDGMVKVWDMAGSRMQRSHTGLACCKWPSQMSATEEAALLPSGHCLVYMDLKKKRPLRALRGVHLGQANCVLFRNDTLEAFSADNSPNIHFWTPLSESDD